MNYKGYIIKDLTATPESAYQNEATIARGFRFAYCKGDIIDEGARDARTLDEAAAEIDELTANDPNPGDIAGDLLRSLKEMVTEFTEANYELVCDHSVGVCACEPLRVLDRAKSAIKWAEALGVNPDTITDKLKIAVQCIEACREEFKYRDNPKNPPTTDAIGDSVANMMINLCANALKAIQE